MTTKPCILAGLLSVTLLVCCMCFPAAGIEVRIDGPTSSPDGNRIAFAVMSDDPKLCVLDLTTSEVETIPFPGYLVEAYYGLSWDPEGRSLITTIIEGTRETPSAFSIWRLDLETSKWTRISEFDTDLFQRGLISPDGKRVLFRGAIKGDLIVADLDSGQRRFLTKSGGIYRLGYDWSPDGKTVFFSRGFLSKKGGIWSIRADGTGKKRVSKKHEPYSLALSKSGRYLAFLEQDGGNALSVSLLTSIHPVELGQDCGYYFSWAPHQDLLAFRCGGSIRVWEPGAEGVESSESIEIAEGDCQFPIWSRGNKGIMFIRDKTSLMEFDVATGVTTELYSIIDPGGSISVGEAHVLGDVQNPQKERLSAK